MNLEKEDNMKRLIASALTVSALCFTGCVTEQNLDLDKISAAIVKGYMTYEQLKEIKEKAEKEAKSTEQAETYCATGTCATDTATQTANYPVIVPVSGKAVAVYLGNESNCSYCKKLVALNPEPYVEAKLPKVDWITADKNGDPLNYAKYRPNTGFSYPLIRVYDATGVFKGDFVARSMTLDAIVTKIESICPSCAD